jgi:hypothetical protein
MKFHLRVYDNYHYMDESEAYNHGEYETYEEALVGAKAIVDEFLVHNWTPGTKPDSLIVSFAFYGEDPIILPVGYGESFSARTYVDTRAAEICKQLENK